jgi:transposase
VRRWRKVWREGGIAALKSKGPVSRERLSVRECDRLEAELKRGPLAHGFAVDTRPDQDADRQAVPQGLHDSGVAKLLKRHGWSCQVPVRHAIERDEDAICGRG